jgi:hypothetical protein
MALLLVSQKTDDAELRKTILSNVWAKANVLVERFVPVGEKDIGPSTRELKVDTAKIAH